MTSIEPSTSSAKVGGYAGFVASVSLCGTGLGTLAGLLLMPAVNPGYHPRSAVAVLVLSMLGGAIAGSIASGLVCARRPRLADRLKVAAVILAAVSAPVVFFGVFGVVIAASLESYQF